MFEAKNGAAKPPEKTNRNRRLLTDHAAYAAALSRLRELQAQDAATNGRIEELGRELRSLSNIRANDSLTSAAAALISGKEGTAANADKGRISDELASLKEKLPVLKRAIQLQTEEVQQQCVPASRAVCVPLQPEHRANVRAVLAALIAIGEANLRESRLRDELEAQGVRWRAYLQPMAFFRGGNPLDPHGPICKWCAEAYDQGFIEASAVPAEWRAAWERAAGYRWGGFRPERDRLPAQASPKHRPVEETVHS